MRVRTRSILASLLAGAVGVIGFTVLSASPSNAVDAAPDSSQQYEQEIVRISVQIDSVEVGAFTDVVVLGSRAKLQEEVPPPVIVLSRPYGPLDNIYAWHQQAKDGDPTARRQFSLVMYDELGEPVSRYFVTAGYPSRIRVEGSVELVRPSPRRHSTAWASRLGTTNVRIPQVAPRYYLRTGSPG